MKTTLTIYTVLFLNHEQTDKTLQKHFFYILAIDDVVTLETKKIERTFRNNFFSKKFFELLNTLQSPCASCMCVVQNSTRYINTLLCPENISHNKKKTKLQSVTECTKHLRKLSLLAAKYLKLK